MKYIFSHAGGTIPYIATRFGIVDEMKVIAGHEERGETADTLRRLYWDTALAWTDPVLNTLRHIAGMDKVVFGTDFPYIRKDLAIKGKQRINTNPDLSADEKKQVFGGNALQLFPRLKNKNHV